MLRAALGFLTEADATQLVAEEQAQCLRALEQAASMSTAARAAILGAFMHKADGGPTSTRDCVLLCWFHHQVVIHRWGWTLVLNPDGTTTAWNPDRTKVLHSHSPPARAG